MLKLLSFQTNDDTNVATYQLMHSTTGREGTTIEAQVIVSKHNSGAQVAVAFNIDPAIIDGNDTEAALNKMADWLIRSGEALKNRGTPENSFAINYAAPKKE